MCGIEGGPIGEVGVLLVHRVAGIDPGVYNVVDQGVGQLRTKQRSAVHLVIGTGVQAADRHRIAMIDILAAAVERHRGPAVAILDARHILLAVIFALRR